MSAPIALGANQPPLFPLGPRSIEQGANALSGPTTPGRRLPVVDRNKVDPQMRQAAEGMEAMFLDYLLKTMRQTVPKNDMDLESPATEIYRGMIDSETAQKAARSGGVGLADQIIAYLQEQRYNLPTGKQTPAAEQGVVPSNDPAKKVAENSESSTSRRTGGTHEGQSDRQ